MIVSKDKRRRLVRCLHRKLWDVRIAAMAVAEMALVFPSCFTEGSNSLHCSARGSVNVPPSLRPIGVEGTVGSSVLSDR